MGQIARVDYGRPMRCAVCETCFEDPHPQLKGRCIYGGPYHGFRKELSDAEVDAWHRDHWPYGWRVHT